MLQTLTGCKSRKSRACSLSVSSLDDSEAINLSRVLCVSDIPAYPNVVSVDSHFKDLPQFYDLEFPILPGATVSL